MIAVATTTVSILRGTDTDAYGDPADNATVAASGLPAALTEQSRLTTDPATGTPRTVHYTTLRISHGTDLRAGDRIRDEGDGSVYIVDETAQVQNPAVAMDLRAELRHLT